MIVAGIDPGANGAVCVLDTNNEDYIDILDLHNQAPYSICKWLYDHKPDVICVESVHSLFGMSAKSNFSFGRNLEMVTTISNIVKRGVAPMTVTPTIWQKYIGIKETDSKERKQAIAEKALELFPNAALYGKNGGLRDGRSDSIMIAYYAINNIESLVNDK